MSLIEFLGLLTAADEAHGEPQTWVMIHTAGMGPRVWAGVGGWPKDLEALSEHTIDDLAERGWVRLLSTDGNGRTFAVTAAGRQAWETELAQSLQAANSMGRVSIDWTAVRPTLERIYDLYRDGGAPAMGANLIPLLQDSEHGREIEAHVDLLVRAEFLEIGRDSAAGPTHVRPTKLTLQMLGGWPGSAGEEALRELVAALDTEIEQTDDVEQRSKLIQVRDGIRGVARDLFLTYLRGDVQALPHHLPHP